MLSSRPHFFVDFMSLFVRSWAAYPSMSTHGVQMGGCMGFIKTLARVARECPPGTVTVCLEAGGSARRRSTYSDYKSARKPGKLNRFYGDDLPESEENYKYQLLTLVRLLKCLPVRSIYIENCEADDMVSYLARTAFLGEPKVILSSDKDMFQVLDQQTWQYDFHSKTFIRPEHVRERFGVDPQNFALCKAIVGDAGDSVPGVKGVGFKTLLKHVPLLASPAPLGLDEVRDYVAVRREEDRVCGRIFSQWDDVLRNWKLVYLGGSLGLSGDQTTRLDGAILRPVPVPDRIAFVRVLVEAGIQSYDPNEVFLALRSCDPTLSGARQ
jgi:hypothetical protein